MTDGSREHAFHQLAGVLDALVLDPPDAERAGVFAGRLHALLVARHALLNRGPGPVGREETNLSVPARLEKRDRLGRSPTVVGQDAGGRRRHDALLQEHERAFTLLELLNMLLALILRTREMNDRAVESTLVEEPLERVAGRFRIEPADEQGVVGASERIDHPAQDGDMERVGQEPGRRVDREEGHRVGAHRPQAAPGRRARNPGRSSI